MVGPPPLHLSLAAHFVAINALFSTSGLAAPKSFFDQHSSLFRFFKSQHPKFSPGLDEVPTYSLGSLRDKAFYPGLYKFSFTELLYKSGQDWIRVHLFDDEDLDLLDFMPDYVVYFSFVK